MKFSILLPTRNRLEYLKTAVASVLMQDYADWELIISDNHSEEDIKSYILSLNEPRIQYSRTETFLSVTDNWNRTVDACTGDYVLMLGDDDCLLKGCLSTLSRLAREYTQPDLIYTQALLYFYPNVVPKYPKGRLITTGNWEFWTSKTPFLLSEEQRDRIIKKTMHFEMAFSFNMQYMVIHRSLIERLKHEGKFFHSPFPDFYAAPLLMLKAKKILGCPYLMTLIGVCPKSFGYYYFNDKEENGADFLNNQKELDSHPELAPFILPGSPFITQWVSALYCVQKNTSPLEFPIHFNRYRRLQILEFLQKARHHPHPTQILSEFRKSLRFSEKLFLILGQWFVAAVCKIFGEHRIKGALQRVKFALHYYSRHPRHEFKEEYSSVLEIFEEIDPLKIYS